MQDCSVQDYSRCDINIFNSLDDDDDDEFVNRKNSIHNFHKFSPFSRPNIALLIQTFFGFFCKGPSLSPLVLLKALTADTFERAAGNIRRAAAACLPASEISAVGLSCTSMSFVLGPDRIDEQLRGACPNAASTDMARAQAAALHALDVTRIALVTPYIEDLAEKNAKSSHRCMHELYARPLAALSLKP